MFVVAELAIANKQEHSAIFTTGDVFIEAADGQRIQPAIQLPGLEKGMWLVQTVQPGATAETRVLFDVDPTATGLLLHVLGLAFRLPAGPGQ
jgi:hypothetical protein